jgi:hypothetical protein
VARPDARGETALTGYVVPDAPPGPGETALRRFLAERLPGHMVPGSIVALDALPMTGAGKIDRVALLEAPATTTRARIAPRSPIETRIAAMWAAVLGVDEVGVEDDFLELGGNSLLATRVVTRVLQDLGVDVPVGPLLSAATVADMALVIVTELAGRAPGSLSP